MQVFGMVVSLIEGVITRTGPSPIRRFPDKDELFRVIAWICDPPPILHLDRPDARWPYNGKINFLIIVTVDTGNQNVTEIEESFWNSRQNLLLTSFA